MTYWGHHAVINAGGCDEFAINDRFTIKAFLKELVERIDMVAYGDPILEEFALHDPHKGGITAIQLLMTSNICIHFVPALREAYFDCFSCKSFEEADVEEVFRKYFNPEHYQSQMLVRSAPGRG
jgi:S-adenosylmethionine/arginine decarboxylase-like enzyme